MKKRIVSIALLVSVCGSTFAATQPEISLQTLVDTYGKSLMQKPPYLIQGNKGLMTLIGHDTDLSFTGNISYNSVTHTKTLQYTLDFSVQLRVHTNNTTQTMQAVVSFVGNTGMTYVVVRSFSTSIPGLATEMSPFTSKIIGKRLAFPTQSPIQTSPTFGLAFDTAHPIKIWQSLLSQYGVHIRGTLGKDKSVLTVTAPDNAKGKLTLAGKKYGFGVSLTAGKTSHMDASYYMLPTYSTILRMKVWDSQDKGVFQVNARGKYYDASGTTFTPPSTSIPLDQIKKLLQ